MGGSFVCGVDGGGKSIVGFGGFGIVLGGGKNVGFSFALVGTMGGFSGSDCWRIRWRGVGFVGFGFSGAGG